MEEPGEQCSVVFAVIVTAPSMEWSVWGGGGGAPRAAAGGGGAVLQIYP
jgi:hypothetical protein